MKKRQVYISPSLSVKQMIDEIQEAGLELDKCYMTFVYDFDYESGEMTSVNYIIVEEMK